MKATRKGFEGFARSSWRFDEPGPVAAELRSALHQRGRGPTAASESRSERISNPASNPRPTARKPCSTRRCTFSSLVATTPHCLPARAERVLHPQDLLGDARPFPLPAMAGRRGEVRRAEPEQIDARHLEHRGEIGRRPSPSR